MEAVNKCFYLVLIPTVLTILSLQRPMIFLILNLHLLQLPNHLQYLTPNNKEYLINLSYQRSNTSVVPYLCITYSKSSWLICKIYSTEGRLKRLEAQPRLSKKISPLESSSSSNYGIELISARESLGTRIYWVVVLTSFKGIKGVKRNIFSSKGSFLENFSI